MLSTFGSDVALGTKEKTFEPGDKWAAFLAADVASCCVSGGRHGDSLSFYRNKDCEKIDDLILGETKDLCKFESLLLCFS